MTALRFQTFDVFTKQRFAGNSLSIVSGADRLSEEQMQAIAREFNFSETVFLLAPRNKAHSARARIFTPDAEVPFAGHPTIGTAVKLGVERLGEVTSEEDAIVVLEEGIGPIRVGVRLRPGQPPFAEFDVPKLPKELPDVPSVEELSMVLGLTNGEIGFENHRPSRFESGLSFVFVPVDDLGVMAKATVDTTALKKLLGRERGMLYLYCRETLHTSSSFHARMFAPLHGIVEDPATGSAAAAFAGVVMKYDQPSGGTKNCVIEQGIEMGRPSQIHLELVVDGALRAVRIGGSVVKVSEGMLEL